MRCRRIRLPLGPGFCIKAARSCGGWPPLAAAQRAERFLGSGSVLEPEAEDDFRAILRGGNGARALRLPAATGGRRRGPPLQIAAHQCPDRPRPNRRRRPHLALEPAISISQLSTIHPPQSTLRSAATQDGFCYAGRVNYQLNMAESKVSLKLFVGPSGLRRDGEEVSRYEVFASTTPA